MKNLVFYTMCLFILAGCGTVGAAEWDYSETSGPDEWSDLSSDYATCGDGESQSPIDIVTSDVTTESSELSFNYNNDNFEVIDTGHALEFKVEGEKPSLTYQGNEYELDQIHFHSVSEHTINGNHYPLEAHFVHHQVDNDEHNLVLSVLFELGDENEIIADKFDNVGSDYDFNPLDLIPNNSAYYSYTGSLTTPPCTEGVSWIIFKDTQEISSEQLAEYNLSYDDDYRPTQDLNGRQVTQNN